MLDQSYVTLSPKVNFSIAKDVWGAFGDRVTKTTNSLSPNDRYRDTEFCQAPFKMSWRLTKMYMKACFMSNLVNHLYLQIYPSNYERHVVSLADMPKAGDERVQGVWSMRDPPFVIRLKLRWSDVISIHMIRKMPEVNDLALPCAWSEGREWGPSIASTYR